MLKFRQIETMSYSIVIHPFLNWVESGTWDRTINLVEETWASLVHARKQKNESQNFGFHY